LTNGTIYPVTLYANSLAGTSVASNSISASPIFAAPGIPLITGIVPLNNSCSVVLGAQVINGSPITTYLYSLDGGNTLIDTNRATSNFLITGLVNGTTYNVRVVAVNALGNSPLSLSRTVTPIYSIPSAPQIVRISIGKRNISIFFKSSLQNGSAIKSYFYSFNYSTTLINTNSIISPIIINNLQSGHSYNVRLFALNDVGYSPGSNVILDVLVK
jgi:titin